MDMFFRALRGTDWEFLATFASPAFFEVVPTLGMARAFGRMVKDYADESAFSSALRKAKKSLPAASPDLSSSPAAQGAAVLGTYFRQIMQNDVAVLDLRSGAFDFKSGKVKWTPKPVFYQWDASFIAGIRQMYRGFYRGDDDAFVEGLEALDLAHAQDIFRTHFGAGDQRSVEFRLEHFRKSFQAIFESCKKNKTRLHPDFFALGAFLLCLYEHLEGLGVPLDVRGAFDAVDQ